MDRRTSQLKQREFSFCCFLSHSGLRERMGTGDMFAQFPNSNTNLLLVSVWEHLPDTGDLVYQQSGHPLAQAN